MKLKHLILFFSLILAACSSRHPVETRFIASPNKQLQAIDSLMWRQPDSALMVLVDFAATPKADSLSAFEGHYCQMLLSELLYKNDYGQSNREKLLKAVRYFDSIVGADETDARKADTRGVSLRDRNAFLDARAHYINGVGFYERDNLVEACAEYLKALEVMEERFEENELTGKLAMFMFYTHNRLLQLFSSQFMMDPAIECGEKALACCLKENSLYKEIPKTYYYLGKQYDKKGEKELARRYYGHAIEGLSDIGNPVYRDVVSTKALSDYQAGQSAEVSLNALRKILAYASDAKEMLIRSLTIGAIFTLEQSFDSALYYLEPVFENQDNVSLQIQAAEYLIANYDNIGKMEKSEECMRFLANHKKSEGESKALTSQLENMFKTYTEQKQAKEAEKEREKSTRKIIGIIVPAALLVALAIIILVKQRSRKMLKQQQEKSDRMLGETEQAHEEELRRLQAETQQRLEETDERHKEEMEKMRQLAIQKQKANVSALLEEQVCQQIICGIKVNNIKRSTKPKDYPELILDETQKIELSAAVEKHCNGFEDKLLRVYPQITSNDLNLCRLFLLGLEEKHAAVLLNRDYSAIRRQSLKLKEAFGTDKEVPFFLKELILNN